MADTFSLSLRRLDGFRFEVDFGDRGIPLLEVDESPPLGEGRGPNPARLLALSVGNCLAASLLFCLQKSRVKVASIAAEVEGEYQRNERNRLRIGRLDVAITIAVSDEDRGKLDRCLGMFEDFCVVTATVRQGVPVHVRVLDPQGALLHEAADES
jgi:uncharacterized OsmC-like protein